jgi:hypothetical protein
VVLGKFTLRIPIMWDVMLHPIPEVQNTQLDQCEDFKTHKLRIFKL